MSVRFVEHEGRKTRVVTLRTPKGVWVGYPGGARFVAGEASGAKSVEAGNSVAAPMTAKVVQARVKKGDVVGEGDLLVVLEAMKMEYRLTAPRAGTVAEVSCTEGELVDLGRVLVSLESVRP